ncbi:6-phosphofructo-2-kinase [Musa troglodytarum]|uniref:6-phosphofructo-2-kinase n=1 Tax=Musa troglodytarum TaxID=320322 RepID=A0A9E7ESF2_9LILI|nr:6-phosphofructo-2-kinase [Musa troglodytarum]
MIPTDPSPRFVSPSLTLAHSSVGPIESEAETPSHLSVSPRPPVTSLFFNLTRCYTSVTPTLLLPYPNRDHPTPSPDQGVPPMGTSASKNFDSSHGGRDGQLYVSLKMENFNIRGDLIPHVYGSAPVTGSWDSAKALSMARESASTWELSFVVPPNHETLDFKFLLKPKYSNVPCVVEEGPSRLLTGGMLQEADARSALFKVGGDEEVLEYKLFIKVDIVSPFDLAASWRAYQENLEPSRVRGIPDVSINVAPDNMGSENGPASTLELDLEHYVVPAPSSSVGVVYAANLTETPRSLVNTGIFSKNDASSGSSYDSSKAGVFSLDHSNSQKDMDTIVLDPPKLLPAPGMVESKSVGTFSPLPKQDGQKGLLVDRGVGSLRLVKSASAGAFTFDPKLDSETKKAMPAAAGAVAAAAVADQMLGPKEDSRLAIVLVGLPARGKTFTAAKLTRYLRWLGHETKHFNVGKYRRLKLGTNQSADFFRGDNPEGLEARNEVAALAMDDMIAWMQEGGQVGIFDATNSTRNRRNMLMKMAEGKCKVNNISGYLPGRIVFFLVNTHLTPRPILLTRHGESRDNVRGRIGGDAVLSEAGELYAKKLANFVEKRLKSERTASIQWRALEEINAGVCDGMTCEEIKKNMPEEYVSRKKDKLRYRYPRGESYLDVIQRLEPVIIELERQRAPVVVISHQAVLRALYAYFADRPLKEIPDIEVAFLEYKQIYKNTEFGEEVFRREVLTMAACLFHSVVLCRHTFCKACACGRDLATTDLLMAQARASRDALRTIWSLGWQVVYIVCSRVELCFVPTSVATANAGFEGDCDRPHVAACMSASRQSTVLRTRGRERERATRAMEDSVDASESFVSLSSILKEEAEDSDEEAEEITAAKKRDVVDSRLEGAEEVDDGVGFIGRLVSNLTLSVPGGPVEGTEDTHKKEEEEDSAGGGLINHLFPNLPVTMPVNHVMSSGTLQAIKMFTARKKIQKEKGAEPTEFEDTAFFDLENGNQELKSDLKDLYINSAVQVDIAGNRKAVVIHVPYRLQKAFRKIHVRLVRELEKKFSGKDVVLIATRRILRPPKKGSAVVRPRSRTLTAVQDATLEDVVYPAEIVGKRIRYRLDGSKTMKIFLDPKERNNTEYKLETFTGVYRKLCGKDVVFEYPVTESA